MRHMSEHMTRHEYWSVVREIAKELGISVQEAREVVRLIRQRGEVDKRAGRWYT